MRADDQAVAVEAPGVCSTYIYCCDDWEVERGG